MRHSDPIARRRALLAMLLAGLACAAPAASASNQSELILFDETPVTGATKHAQSVRDAPARVTVITRDDIDRFGYRTLAEALRSVAGLYVSGDREADHIGVRGFSRPDDFNDRILLLVDGHTYNNDVFQQAYVGQDFGIDLEAVDHIEVIRGPGSALYGGNALFAVINVVTVTGAQQPGVHLLTETGSFWRKRGQASVGHVTDSGVDLFASGSVLDVDGQESLFYPAYDSPATHDGIARDADAERALKFFSSARYGGFTLEGGTSWREKHIPTAAYFTTFDDPGTKTTDARQFAEARWEGESVASTDVTARLFYDGAQYHGTYIYGAGASRVKNQDLAMSHWFGGELEGRRELFTNNTLTLGTEYTYHPDAEQKNFDQGGQQFLDDVRPFGTLGIYAQDEWRIIPKVSLVTGLRYDRYYTRLQQVSPRAGVVWTATPQTTVKALYGNAFRPPNLYEQYYAYPSLGTRSLANPNLNPERITTYEGIVEQDLWAAAQATLAIYHNRISDLIQQVKIANSDDVQTLQFRNDGSAKATGGDVELHVPLPHGIVGHASYSYQDARDDSGRSLTNSPRHLGQAGVTAPLAFGLEGAAELIIVGPRRALDRRRLEAARVLNLSLRYRTPIRHLGLTAGLYNVFDQTYPDPGGAEHLQDRIPQDGLTFRVQLTYEF